MKAETQSRKAYLMALAFVCFGFALGIFSDRLFLYVHHTRMQSSANSQREVTLNDLASFFSARLKLSPGQVRQFKGLLRKYLKKGMNYFRNRPPAVRKFVKKAMHLRYEFRADMRKMLNEKQKTQFNKMITEADTRRMGMHFQHFRFRQMILDEENKKK